MTAAAVPEPEWGGDLPDVAVRDVTEPKLDLPDDPDPAAALPTDKIVRYQALYDEKARLTAELAVVAREKAELEAELVEAFAEAQTDNTRVRGRTTYLHRTLHASKAAGVTTDQLCAALREAGLEHFIADNVSASTLSGYARDLDKADEPLPPPLAAVLTTYEKYEIRVRAGSTTTREKK